MFSNDDHCEHGYIQFCLKGIDSTWFKNKSIYKCRGFVVTSIASLSRRYGSEVVRFSDSEDGGDGHGDERNDPTEELPTLLGRAEKAEDWELLGKMMCLAVKEWIMELPNLRDSNVSRCWKASWNEHLRVDWSFSTCIWVLKKIKQMEKEQVLHGYGNSKCWYSKDQVSLAQIRAFQKLLRLGLSYRSAKC